MKTNHISPIKQTALMTILGMLIIFNVTADKASEEILSSIEIQASPESVWQVLTKFSDYPNWSQFIETISWEKLQTAQALSVGQQLQIRVVPPNEDGMDFTPVVLVFNESTQLRWKGNIAGMSFLFSGEHYFKLERTAQNHTRLIHGEVFNGWLLPLLWSSILENTPAGFEAFNLALKTRVEKKEP
ncbi:MAG: SRPBCC domain-containing protein [Bermanella sp.]